MKNNQYIILDTNIWVYTTKLLADPMSAALLFYLNSTGGKIIIPEVIEKEITINLHKIAKEACNEIDKQYSLLQRMFGVIDDYKLPTTLDIQQVFSRRVEELSNLIVQTPFTFAHAKGALERVLNGTPPNRPRVQKSNGDQQFKDSTIWEAAIELSNHAKIIFITRDYGFYKNRNPEKGLAESLLEEVSMLKNEISVYPDIQSFLKDIKGDIPKLNAAKVRKTLFRELENNKYISEAVSPDHTGFLNGVSFKAFLTEKNSQVAIHYSLKYDVANVEHISTSESLGPGVMIVSGNCLFDFVNENVSSNSIDEIVFKDPQGFPLTGKGASTFANVAITLGRGKRFHRLRAKMPNELLS